MGSVPLLTRQAEITLARSMERGKRRVLGSLAQCPAVEEELRFLDEQIQQQGFSPEFYFENETALSNGRLRAVRLAIERFQDSRVEVKRLETRLLRLKPDGRAYLRTA
jgi:hypothetical protein